MKTLPIVTAFFGILLSGCYSCKDSGRALIPASTTFSHVTIEAGFYSPETRIELSKEDASALLGLFADCNVCNHQVDPGIMGEPAISYVVTFRSRRSTEMFAPRVDFGPFRGLYDARCKHVGTNAKVRRILNPYMDKVDQLAARKRRDTTPVY